MKKILMMGLIISTIVFGNETKTVEKKIDNEISNKEMLDVLNEVMVKAQMDIMSLNEKIKREVKNDEDYKKIKKLITETLEYNKKMSKNIKEQWEIQEINFDKIKENIEKEFTAKPDIIIKTNEKTTK